MSPDTIAICLLFAALVAFPLVGLFLTLGPGRRLYTPSLPRNIENAYVQKIIDDMAKTPETWKIDEYHATKGEFSIWLANEPYADMNIKSPHFVNTRWWNARKLRRQVRMVTAYHVLKP
jgi:hypothetical protein